MIIDNVIKIKQTHREFILTSMSAKVLGEITYTAVRGMDDEVGAVQRILIERRIKGIKDFVLSGGDFPAAIVLNWTNKDNIKIHEKSIEFDVISRLAQIIDGQHRVAGIKAAIKEDVEVEDLQIPVVIYINLTTRECADIFWQSILNRSQHLEAWFMICMGLVQMQPLTRHLQEQEI